MHSRTSQKILFVFHQMQVKNTIILLNVVNNLKELSSIEIYFNYKELLLIIIEIQINLSSSYYLSSCKLCESLYKVRFHT